MMKEKIGGFLILIGVSQFLLCLKIAEFLYPNYSVANNYISDLGVGPVAYIFNGSIILMGVLGILAAYLLFKWNKVFSLLLLLSSIGAIGVGVFPEGTGILHSLSALITFLFSGLGAIYSYRVDDKISRFIWPVLGVISLVALGLFINHIYLGLGAGGMERIIVYPVFIWLIGISTVIIHET